MTYMITFGFITRNSMRANKLGHSFGADMTDTTMPQGSGRSGGGESGYAARGEREERVEVTRAIAPGDHAPHLKVLHRKAKRIELD
jgi:hypothetical protein